MDKVDWNTAPKDAQFYSCEYFRKHEDDKEFCWVVSIWHKDRFDPLEWHEKRYDFEMRHESPVWDGKGFPPVGATCEHHSGRLYRVEGYTNENTTRPEQYPITIIYQNVDNGALWSRPAAEWFRSFRPIKSKHDEREEWIIEAQKHCAELVGKQLGCIYDAMKDGRLEKP